MRFLFPTSSIHSQAVIEYSGVMCFSFIVSTYIISFPCIAKAKQITERGKLRVRRRKGSKEEGGRKEKGGEKRKKGKGDVRK